MNTTISTRDSDKLIKAGLLLASLLTIATVSPTGGQFMPPPRVSTPTAPLAGYGTLPLSFEVNAGQSDPRVRFMAHGSGYNLFLTATEAVLALSRQPADKAETARTDTTVVRMALAGANVDPQINGLDPLPGRVNYFRGSDPAQWHTDIPTYAAVGYRNVYPGIDVRYYGNQRQLEYDFIVAPGANPQTIALRFDGVSTLELDDAGDLILHTPDGQLIRQRKPFVYQELDGRRAEVASAYALHADDHVGFQIGTFDPGRPLIIDPVLVYSSYLGGTGFDQGYGITVDASGNAYVVGQTFALDFPTTPGAYQTNPPGSFITKINAAGSALVYSSYLAGGGGNAVAVDAAGQAYVVGDAFTLDFPVTPGAFQTSPMGYDVSLTKFNATGSALIYSSRFGGGFDDHGVAIALDAAGNAYLTGWTVCSSPTCDFPTVNAFQPDYGGGNNDAFVTKINAQGSAPVYSTYLGGGAILNTTDDWGAGIAVDGAGSAYVTGHTFSQDFPVTAGAYKTNGGGNLDGFVTKFTPQGSALVYSTFLGGNDYDQALNLAIDGAGNAYVTGTTDGLFPTTPGAFQTNGSFDAFVTKLNATGSALIYSTYLGGSAGVDRGWGIKVGSSGNAYVVGDTTSSNFPTQNAIQPGYGGGLADAFVTKLNATGTALVYSTFLGGNLSDEGPDIALDSSGNAYVTGYTSSYQFPVSRPFQGSNGGGIEHHDDAFVAKISETAPPPPTADLSVTMNDSPDPAGMGASVTYTLDVSNAGPDQATATVLTVRIDPSLNIVSITPDQGSCGTPDGANIFTCALGTISTGTTTRVTVVVTTPQAIGSFGSDAFVSSFQFDSNNSNNTGQEVTTVFNNPPPSPTLSSLTLKPTSVTGGATATGTVTLSSAAPSGGALVTLSSSNTAVATVPGSVLVSAGTITKSFTVTTQTVSASTGVTISATYGGTTKTATETVMPVPSTDTVTVKLAEYITSTKQLRVQATSTSASAVLRVYQTSTNNLIGKLTNLGGGKYSGQFPLATNPQNVTVKSSLGGSATKVVTVK